VRKLINGLLLMGVLVPAFGADTAGEGLLTVTK
jgi:hypothetical protein